MKKMLSVILVATMLLSGGVCGKSFYVNAMGDEGNETSESKYCERSIVITIPDDDKEREFTYKEGFEANSQENSITSNKPSKLVSFVKSTLKVLVCAYISAVGAQVLSQKFPQAGQFLAKNVCFWNNMHENVKQKFNEFLEKYPQVKSALETAENSLKSTFSAAEGYASQLATFKHLSGFVNDLVGKFKTKTE